MAEPRRILFVTIPEKGHVNPLIGPAQVLADAGHELAFFAADDLTPQLARAGLSARSYTPGPAPPRVSRGAAFVEQLRDRAWLRRWIAELLVESVPSQVPALRKLIRELRPHVVVTDPMVYAAVLAADAEGVPWAGVSSSLNPVTPGDWRCELTDTVRELSPARGRLFAAHGPVPRFAVCDAISPWLNTVFTVEDYAPRARSGNDFSFYVGAPEPQRARGDEQPFPWARLDEGAPLVYLSLGSQLFHHPELFVTVAAALADSDVQLVISAGDLAADEPFLRRLPERTIVVSYAPQLPLLERAQLVLTHGGANSVVECLRRGLPMVMLPVCNDQHLQARFLLESGAGRVLDPTALTVENTRAAVLPLLTAGAPERKRAQAVGRAFSTRNGAARTAELIAALARSGQPQRPV